MTASDSSGPPQSEKQEILRENFGVESTLADVSVLLLNAEPQTLEDVLRQVANVLGLALEVDRVVVYGFAQRPERFYQRASWAAQGIAAADAPFDGVATAGMAWWTGRLRSGVAIRVSSLAELPAEAQSERELLVERSVRSILALPLVSRTDRYGFISLQCLGKEHPWSDSECALAATVANLLVGTLKRMRALEELQSSQRLGRTILDSIDTAVSLIDVRTRRVVDVNRAYLAGFDVKKSEVVGRPCHEITKRRGEPCMGPEDECPLHAVALTGAPTRVSNAVAAPDGSKTYYEISVSPVRDATGEVVQVVHLVQDVTQHRLSEETLRRSSETAEAALEAKSIFLANVSHELRTPLNPIVAMSKLLELTPLDGEQRRYVELIQRGAEQLLSTVNDLLDYSKAAAGRLELERVEFDLAEVLGQCVGLCAAECHQRGLELQRHIDENVPAVVRGDPFRLKQVLHNLLGNATKFTRKGVIKVRVMLDRSDADAGTLRFEVTDTGMGIAAERQQQLFESFVQADASVSRLHGGTGLGLAISKQLVALMRGQIGVVSEEGKGSTFWFTAPLEAQPQSAQDVAPGEPSRAGRTIRDSLPAVAADSVPRILVVEDDKSNQLVAQKILERGGYRVDVVGGGQEALERLRREPYDLVLMDVQMPGMNGIEATRCIRDPTQSDLPTQVPIVAATAFAQDEDRDRCREVGMDDFVTKPIDPRVLLDIIQRQLLRTPT